MLTVIRSCESVRPCTAFSVWHKDLMMRRIPFQHTRDTYVWNSITVNVSQAPGAYRL